MVKKPTKKAWQEISFKDAKAIKKEWKKSHWYQSARKSIWRNSMFLTFFILSILGLLIFFSATALGEEELLYGLAPIGMIIFLNSLLFAIVNGAKIIAKEFKIWLMKFHHIGKN